MSKTPHRWPHLLMLLCGIVVIGFFFGMTEIQIEGGNGWACALPTWRIESHPLLDIFWGGQAHDRLPCLGLFLHAAAVPLSSAAGLAL